jgi:CTP:molybdopterin cytidylyltransferase MocA
MTIFKPTLPLDGHSVIQNTILSLQQAGIQNITVVTGFRSKELEAHLKPYQVSIRKNYSYQTSDMFTSIQQGIEFTKHSIETILILPGDIPLIRPSTITGLIRQFRKNSQPILVPSFNGRGGHPVILKASFRRSLMNWQGGQGLRGWLQKFKHHIHYALVPDMAICLDLDTPRQYRHALTILPRRHIPNILECRFLLQDILKIDQDIIKHSETVTSLACYLASLILQEKNTRHLPDSQIDIDMHLLAASCLLHDICKGQPDHAQQGAAYLHELGFPEVAAIVASHMDHHQGSHPLNEKSLLYLADKCCQGNICIDPDERFSNKLKQYPHPKAQEKILNRSQQFNSVRCMFEDITGISLNQVITRDIDTYATTLSSTAWQNLLTPATSPFYRTKRYSSEPGRSATGTGVGRHTAAHTLRYDHNQPTPAMSAHSRYHLP